MHPFHGYRMGIRPQPVKVVEAVRVKSKAMETYAINQKITDVLNSNSWKRRHVFIIGGGYSLANFDFDVLKNETTIAINQAWEHYEATIFYGMDVNYIDWLKKGSFKEKSKYGAEAYNKWRSTRSIKVFACPSGYINFGGTVFLVRRRLERVVSRDINYGIYVGNNSGVGAMMLAAALGATTINLLGIDLKLGEEASGEKRSHFHKGYPIDAEKEKIQEMFEEYRQDFESCKDAMIAGGVKVFNLNEQSELKCFEFRSLGEALAARMRE